MMDILLMFRNVILLEQIVYLNALTKEVKVGHIGRIFNATAAFYNTGVHIGIINSTKYSLRSFEQDQPTFREAYEEYISMVEDRQLIDYQHWLILNNYGILEDTQESLLRKKTKILRNKNTSTKKRFMRTVKTGDILISTRNTGGLIGHAAIMVSDYWVLEMRGGENWQRGIRNNNRQISKSDWFDEFEDDWTTVYRCPDSLAADEAAQWADITYFNDYGGQDKTICVTYKITPDFRTIDPSYSSKLVLQAYYYGARVISDVTRYGAVIAPSRIPSYFLPPYNLMNMGKF